jgi:hypothetical protein
MYISDLELEKKIQLCRYTKENKNKDSEDNT